MTEQERETMRADIAGVLADFTIDRADMSADYARALAVSCLRYDLTGEANRLRAYANGQDDARTGRGLSLSAPAAEIAAYLAGAKAAGARNVSP